MAKYNEAFKYQVVQEYLSGGVGTQALGQKYGLDRSIVRRWVSAWQHHGQAGLRKKRETYGAEFKLTVLQHMWRHELSYRQTSAVFDLREATGIGRWERQYHEGGFEALKPRRKGRPPKMQQPKHASKPVPTSSPDDRSREDLLKENEYLRAEVAYLKKLDALLRAKEQTGQKKKRKP